MDAKSAIIALLSKGPWPVLTSVQLDALIANHFQAFQPANLDARKLLIAMAGNESSGGKDCLPRHEMAYCTGTYSTVPSVVHLTDLYGHNAHCSFGPWQIMLINCSDGTDPADLHDADACAKVTADYIERLNTHKKPQSVAQWGQLWNGGHIGADNPGVRAYVAKLQHNYDNAQ